MPEQSADPRRIETVSAQAQAFETETAPSGTQSHGAVYTKPWVVDLVLNMASYTADRDLASLVAVEPSCGDGGFLVEMATRLIESARSHGRPFKDLTKAIVAFELDSLAANESRTRVLRALNEAGCPLRVAESLAATWVTTGDFLLSNSVPQADVVVGNPPYVRIEDLDPETLATYRARFSTMQGRADLYIGFFESSLSILRPDGVLSFICADRWMLNQYGGALRRLVTSEFAVDAVIEMHNADAFHDAVLAYPAITRIRKGSQASTSVARVKRGLSGEEAESLLSALRGDQQSPSAGFTAMRADEWFEGNDPWPCTSPDRLSLLKRWERDFLPIEQSAADTRVGIGVATGSDRVFITTDPDLVESSQMLPLAWHKDTLSGEFRWSGRYLVSPWGPDGSLLDLDDFPRLRAYYESNSGLLRKRKIASKNVRQWYRTIDNLRPGLLSENKLLIPDIKGHLHPVLESGQTYPHHNLYYVVSGEWPLRSLGGLLLSDVAQFFIDCYSVKMAGGYFRFQAQYLRRIRLPRPEDLGHTALEGLAEAFDARDSAAANRIAHEIYGIDALPS